LAARSVAELLPAPFSELTLDDVAAIIEAVGEERESLFFERKAAVSPASLAKSCAAFANTFGGLLVVGIEDATDDLVGIEPVAEPQVWVKDVLRGHLLPLPPFRARALSVGPDRALLLVLVEESSATPHLLTRHGAIYVRNPGSSDPVPISDQSRLLELTRRGEEARARAWNNALNAAARSSISGRLEDVLVGLCATGIGDDFPAPLFGPGADLVELRAILGDHEDNPADRRAPFWTQHSASVERRRRPLHYPVYPDSIDAIEVWRDGSVLSLSGVIPGPETSDYFRDNAMPYEVLRDRISGNLDAAVRALLEFGAHGDAALAVTVRGPQRLHWSGGQRYGIVDGEIVVRAWISLEDNEGRRSEIVDVVLSEIGRALGFPPPEAHAAD